MKKILPTILLVLILSLVWVSLVAAEAGDADIEGQITVVDDVAKTITVVALDGAEYLVSFPAEYEYGFTLEDIGTYVHVIGEFLDEASILAESVEELTLAEIEGEVIGVSEDGCTITVKTMEGEEFLVHLPECGYTSDDIWSWVHVQGVFLGDGSILAESIEEIEPPEDEGKEDSAYCSGEKEKPHPAATKIAAAFDVTYEEVMGYFCDGFGFGQIVLAYQTSKITGVDASALLASREEGKGWGVIWKELGFHGKPKEAKGTEEIQEGKVPPGQQKKTDDTEAKNHPSKPEKAKNQDKDKDKNKDKKDK